MKYTLLALALSGCAVFDMPSHCTDLGDGRCWFKSSVQIPVKEYRWEVDTSLNASNRCGYGFHYHNASCVMGRLRESGVCHVVSALTEAQAKRTPSNSPRMNWSIYEHEMKHCEGWVHSDGVVWGLR